MSDTVLGYLLAGTALLLFTSGILVTKSAASRINLNLGFLIAATTNVVFAALAFAAQLAFFSSGVQWNSRAFLLFAVAGAFSTYLGRWFFYEAVVRFGPSRASVFQVSSPLFTALIAWLLLGESLSMLLLAGIVVTIGGLMLVSYRPGASVPGPAAPDKGSRSLFHKRLLQSVLVLGLGSSMAYAVGNVLRGLGIRNWNEPVLGALVGASSGLLLHLLFNTEKRGILGRLRAADRTGAFLYLFMGMATISAQICAIAAMRYIPVSVATLVTLCTPVLVFPLSRLFLKNNEDIGPSTLAGCGLTLLGILLIVLR